MLDKNDLQAIAELIHTEVSASEQRVTAAIDEKIAASEQRTKSYVGEQIAASEERMKAYVFEKVTDETNRSMAYIESAIEPKIDLALEGHVALNEKIDRLASNERVERIELDISIMKQVIRQHSEEIEYLKKAQ